jgi:hypothetical protein
MAKTKKKSPAKKYPGMRHKGVVRQAAKKIPPRTNRPC